MFNKQLKANIKHLDVTIGEIYEKLSKAETDDERKELLEQAKELTSHRSRLSTVKTREAVAPVVLPAVMPAIAGLSAILVVLNYEKKDIITSKAIGFATRLFRGY